MTGTKLLISFRGHKIDFPLSANRVHGERPEPTIGDVKSAVIDAAIRTADEEEGGTTTTDKRNAECTWKPADIQLIWQGKVLVPDERPLCEIFDLSSNSGTTTTAKKKIYKVLGRGLSNAETLRLQNEEGRLERQTARLVKDDLSAEGQQKLRQRSVLGRRMMKKQQQRGGINNTSSKYGFGSIETLPNLPHETQARQMLETLVTEPGILACMAKHEWNVGCLAELYPDGKVGESPVCVMGLNQNKGQKILLRLRTDDLQGFRKPLSIRKVLYHELSHNVHSEHDDQFFQLMRQIERECQALDWTNGAGITTNDDQDMVSYTAGAFHLGGHISNDTMSVRELAAEAAERRMTAEEKEIELHCGCNIKQGLFLPESEKRTKEGGDDTMDTP